MATRCRTPFEKLPTLSVGDIGQADDVEVAVDRRPQGGIGQAIQASVVGQVLASVSRSWRPGLRSGCR